MTPQPQIVYVAVYDTLADWEVGYAIAHINRPDWQREPGRYVVRTVGRTREPVTTVGGMRIVPDAAIAEVTPQGSAMLILPGADTWLPGDNADFGDLAGRFLDAGVPVAAICGATLGLAAAGLLEDRAHTSNAPEFLTMASGYTGKDYRDEPAVTDRGVITASAMHPIPFARHIFAELDLYSPAVLEAWTGLYSTGEPQWYGRLVAAAAGTDEAPA